MAQVRAKQSAIPALILTKQIMISMIKVIDSPCIIGYAQLRTYVLTG